MNNEPVAWMVDGVLFNSLGAALNISFDIEQPCIPLYTHPVKELTDEEIEKYVKEWELKELKENSASTNYVQELAFIDGLTWLLRKAQEK